MTNRIFGIVCNNDSDLLPIISDMAEIKNHEDSNCTTSYIQSSTALYCSQDSGFFEDKKIVVMADSNITLNDSVNQSSVIMQWNSNKGTDAAQLAHMYHLYGKSLLEYIKGAFAFVIWDKVRRELFGARDHLGIKNLFYSHPSRGMFLFATELKAILRSGMVEKIMDQNAIYHFLFMKAFEQPSTPLQYIKSLMPGHYFILNDLLVTKKYWDIVFTSQSVADENGASAKVQDMLSGYFHNYLDNASPQSYGILLSGGIDSSYLTALLAEYTGKPVRTFTIRFGEEGSIYDETEYARIVSRALNTQHTEIEINANSLSENLLNTIRNMNTPVANSGYKLASMFRSSESDGLKHIFLGEGADTLFGLDSRWNQFEQLEKYLVPFKVMPEYLRELFYSYFEKQFGLTKRIINTKHIRGLHRYFFTKSGYFKWKGSGISEGEIKKLFVDKSNLHSIRGLYRNLFKAASTGEFSNKCVYTTLKTYTPNQQLTHYTSICSAYGAEALYPFLDISLLKYCLNLPHSLKTRSGITKYLLYQLAKPVLPKEVIERPKMVFHMPFENWTRGKLRPIIDKVFSYEQIEKRGIFDYKEMRGLYESYFVHNNLPWVDLWTFVVLELWFILFLDSTGTQVPSSTIEDLLDIRYK